jgi:hypothetical protein
MTIKGVEIVYSPLANEIIRLIGSALFTGNHDNGQTHMGGLVEGIMVMYYLATGNKAAAHAMTEMRLDERNRSAVKFYLENEDEIDTLKPQILKRLESVVAASVESEDGGKPTRDAVPAF